MKTIQFAVAKEVDAHDRAVFESAVLHGESGCRKEFTRANRTRSHLQTQKERGPRIPLVDLQSFVSTSSTDMGTPHKGKPHSRDDTSPKLDWNEQVVAVLASLFQSNENT